MSGSGVIDLTIVADAFGRHVAGERAVDAVALEQQRVGLCIGEVVDGDQFEAAGCSVSGTSPDGKLAEIIEIRGHRFFVAVQFHPEFQSKPNAPHPIFAGFVKAAMDHRTEVRVRA